MNTDCFVSTQKISPESEISILENVPLAHLNWFKAGGNARFFCEPTTAAQWAHALKICKNHNLPIFILGAGANILISDAGFDGMVIRPRIIDMTMTPTDNETAVVTAGAGVLFEDLINFCFEQGYGGLEEFSGIPSTVGGACYINLHYFEFLLSHFLFDACVIERHTGIIETVSPEWFKFGYNQSTLQQETHYLVSARFKVHKRTPYDIAYARGRSYEIKRYRASRYPASHTCGSFFRNFFFNEIPFEINGKKIIYVAYYLDKIGVKGALSIGGAAVSHQHANMIVNCNQGTAHDIISVAREMQQRVYEQFGIMPKPECRLIGFEKNVL